MVSGRMWKRRILTDRELNMDEIPSDTYILCPLCPDETWVSPEDAAASQTVFINHLKTTHQLQGIEFWGPVLAQAQVVTSSAG